MPKQVVVWFNVCTVFDSLSSGFETLSGMDAGVSLC
jgi:hypothetical protein